MKKEKETKLETVDIDNVEILAAGTWKGNKVVEIAKEAIPQFVDSFNELIANDKLNYEPPVKLGHDENQKILQADGYPAAGWINSLKASGDKLVATFKAVPKKLAEIIKAGGYKKVSAEFYQNYEIGGKVYPWVLKAVSLLGADVPAVKTIADIQALYSEQDAPYIVFYEAGASLDKQVNNVREAYYNLVRNPVTVERDSYVSEIFDDYIILEKAGKFYKVPYSQDYSGIAFDLNNAVEVKKEVNYVAVQPEQTPEASPDNTNKNTEQEVNLEDKAIRELLNLDEKADVLAAVTELKKKSEAQAVSLTEHQTLTEENKKLTLKLAERERDERVTMAINAGKITPAQKSWAETYAMSDPKGFDAFVAGAPKVIDLSEKGKEGGEPENVHLTETEIKIGQKLGLTVEDLKNAKKQEAK